MAGVRLIAAVCALTLLGGLATAARADDLNAGKAVTDRNQWGPQSSHKSFLWDQAKGRWGLKFDMEEPSGRDMDWKDVAAGAYFKVTPSLRIGGAVTLGDSSGLPKDINPPPAAPRVRLETAFKF
jgi:hypothetical protein